MYHRKNILRINSEKDNGSQIEILGNFFYYYSEFFFSFLTHIYVYI